MVQRCALLISKTKIVTMVNVMPVRHQHVSFIIVSMAKLPMTTVNWPDCTAMLAQKFILSPDLHEGELRGRGCEDAARPQ